VGAERLFKKRAVRNICARFRNTLLRLQLCFFYWRCRHGHRFAADLHDFIRNDISRAYADLVPFVSVTLVEAGGHVLGNFDASLRDYALASLRARRISVRLHTSVRAVTQELPGDAGAAEHRSPFALAHLSDGSALPFGAMVWSAGLAPVKLTEALGGLAKGPAGRIIVDPWMRVPGLEGRVWALGDCAVYPRRPLPPIAQAAQQQGQYVAAALNRLQPALATAVAAASAQSAAAASSPSPVALAPSDTAAASAGDGPPFELFGLGAMANLGIGQGLLDTTDAHPSVHAIFGGRAVRLSGALAWVMWKGAYWILRQVSWRNRLLIPMHWLKTWVFGRDITRHF
jgi:NADH dehydrogenase FAD-containing subunit